MWRSRWRCVIKPAYSASFLLPINIFVWQNVLYFLDAPRTLTAAFRALKQVLWWVDKHYRRGYYYYYYYYDLITLLSIYALGNHVSHMLVGLGSVRERKFILSPEVKGHVLKNLRTAWNFVMVLLFGTLLRWFCLNLYCPDILGSFCWPFLPKRLLLMLLLLLLFIYVWSCSLGGFTQIYTAPYLAQQKTLSRCTIFYLCLFMFKLVARPFWTSPVLRSFLAFSETATFFLLLFAKTLRLPDVLRLLTICTEKSKHSANRLLI